MANREWSPSGDPLPFSGRPPTRYWLAHWWPRVGATLLDGLILVPVYIVLVFGFHLYSVTHEQSASGATVPRFHYHTLGLALLALVPVVYSVVLLCRGSEHNGQTWGKQVAGLKVIRNDGEQIDVRTALVREGLVKALPGLLGVYLGFTALSSLFSLLDDLWPLGDRENRAIHDHVAKTHVVQTHSRPAFAPPPLAPAAASALSPGELPPSSGAGGMPLGEVPLGRNVYVALSEIARDSIGRCWIKAAALVQAAPDDVHLVRVSNAPEGLFVSLPESYEPVLASPPSETARGERTGWRSAALTFF